MKKLKWLITGGKGFIGQEIVRQLLEREDTEFVYIIDNDSKNETKNELNFNLKDKRVKIDNTDLSNQCIDHGWSEHTNTAVSICNDFKTYYLHSKYENGDNSNGVYKLWKESEDKEIQPDFIIHAAAKIGGIRYFHQHPFTILDENNKINSIVFEIIKKWKYKGRFIDISSSMVFEATRIFPTPESSLEETIIPLSHYGFSKLSGEKYCEAYSKEFGLDYVICRPFNAWNIAEYPSKEIGMAHLLPDIIRKIYLGQGIDSPLEILGDGSQIRVYTHCSDVASGIILCALSGKSGETYNVSDSLPLTVLEVTKLIWEQMQPNIPFENVKIKNLTPFEFDVQKRIPDVSKMKKELNWVAKISLNNKDELHKVIEWVKMVVDEERN